LRGIAELYAIAGEILGKSPEERLAVRQQRRAVASACPAGVRAVKRNLWQPADDAGVAGQRLYRWPPTNAVTDVRARHQGPPEAPVQTHH